MQRTWDLEEALISGKMSEGGVVESWGRLGCWWGWFCLAGSETTLKLGPLRAEIVEIPGVQIVELKRWKYWTKRCIEWEARSNYWINWNSWMRGG